MSKHLEQSSGSSEGDMDSAHSYHSSSDDEIEHVYNPTAFGQLKPEPNFVLEGQNRWDRVRTEWTKNSTATFSPSGGHELFNIDVEQLLVCMQGSHPFPMNVPLATVVEILTVLWEDGPQ